jgi:vacuolar-type H+-ATPase subunit C/Vma6
MRKRTAIADNDTVSTRQAANDLDYLAARLHGRRSSMAEGERLTGLCRIRGLSELARTICPGSESERILDVQRLLVFELARELSGFLAHMSGPGASLLNWTLERFRVENLKVLLRAFLTKPPAANPQEYLAPLPKELALNSQDLESVESLDDFVRLVPKGPLRRSLEEALEIYHDRPRPFFFEAALDHGYFQGLLAGVEELSGEDREIVNPMVCQEVDVFHLMLVIRGRFHYGLTPEKLLPLHVAGTRISRTFFTEMLSDQDLSTAAGRAAGRVFDGLPFDRGPTDGSAAVTNNGSSLERLAWKRYLRLANLAFRQSHMGLGAVVGYAGIRRMEVANLITISEGIRKSMGAETIRARLITYSDAEAAHV